MGFQGAAENKIEQMVGTTINGMLIVSAIVLIAAVIFIQNKWLKAAILAWVVLP